MSAFDEAKSPLTLDNVHSWARDKFPGAFVSLPPLDLLTFVDIDTLKFSRIIRRSLHRSTHKKLLIVGAYAPGHVIEDAEICAHIHADEGTVSFFRIDELDDGDHEVHSLRGTSTIAFHAPFSDVGDDSENSKAISRVEALISYYFLAAGHLEELIRHNNFANLFTRGFEHACRWIENGGERPTIQSSKSTSARGETLQRLAANNVALLCK
jgi:hypothetical protein